MDFGLDALVAMTPPAAAGAGAPPLPAAGGAEKQEVTAFAAHLAAGEEDLALDDATQLVEDALAASAAPTAAFPTLPLQPAPLLLQLIDGGPGNEAAIELAPDAGATMLPAVAANPSGADTAKMAPLFNEDGTQAPPTPTAPTQPAPAAETAAAPASHDAVPSPPPTAPAIKPADLALAASTATQASAAPSASGIASTTKPVAKSAPASKSDVADATAPTPAPASEALVAAPEAANEPVRNIDVGQDRRASTPQADSRRAGAAPLALGADSGAAPTSSPPASSAASGAAPTFAAGISDSAAPLQARASETAPAATQVAQEIVRRFDGDTTRFEVRLDPPELGRVEVRLEVTRDNKVTATVVADSPQTLVELARHARDLQHSLQAAGLDFSENGLSFDLRDNGRDAHSARSEGHGRDHGSANNSAMNETAPQARAGGLDPWRGRTLDVTA